MEIEDLRRCVKIGMPEAEIAKFLCRTVGEIREKTAGLLGEA
jgi:hypothetical protein